MITKNFKAIMAAVLESCGNATTNGYLPVKNTSGVTCYMGGRFYGFPYSESYTVIFTPGSGVHVGSGNTAPTEDDYDLESEITSGLTANTAAPIFNVDADGNPYIDIVFTLTNTTASDITVREVGYVQQNMTASTLGSPVNDSARLLMDRTLLDSPVIVPANGAAAIKYTLKTLIS